MSFKTAFDHWVEVKLLPFLFKISEQPMLFNELLVANKAYQDKMSLESISGFRLLLGRTYLVYILLWHLFIAIPIGIFHKALTQIDCHLLVLVAVLFTGIFFATFSIFNEWLHEKMALQLIKRAWKNHFPHFKYDQHAAEVATIYTQALEEEVHHKDMRLYIINRMVAQK